MMGINELINEIKDMTEKEFMLNLYWQDFFKEIWVFLVYHDDLTYESKLTLIHGFFQSYLKERES